jgi:Flp pilus assembly pilin Flp
MHGDRGILRWRCRSLGRLTLRSRNDPWMMARVATVESGQALLEYAIAIAVAVLVVMGSVKLFGQAISDMFTRLIGLVQGIG